MAEASAHLRWKTGWMLGAKALALLAVGRRRAGGRRRAAGRTCCCRAGSKERLSAGATRGRGMAAAVLPQVFFSESSALQPQLRSPEEGPTASAPLTNKPLD